jgi:hypothetical protein
MCTFSASSKVTPPPTFRCSPIHEEWVRCRSYPHVSTCQNIQTLSILDNLHT